MDNQKEFWWLAINGASCAASAIASEGRPDTSPRPDWMVGFPTREEQLKAQTFLLNAPMDEVRRFIDVVLKERLRLGQVEFYQGPNPEPPTTGQTLWMFPAKAGIEKLVAEADITEEDEEFVRMHDRIQHIKSLWDECGKLEYTLPSDQVPYLAAISLDAVTVGQIQLPAPCVRFQTDEIVAYVVQDLAGRLQFFFEANTNPRNLATVFAPTSLDDKDKPVSEWLEIRYANECSSSYVNPEELTEFRAGQMRIVTAIITTLFIRDAKPEYFHLDVFARDRVAYDEAKRRGDRERMSVIEERVKRRRGEHYEFHTGSSWLCDFPEGEPTHFSPQGRGGEHSYTYMVRGHYRRQHHGPGNHLVRVIYLPPQIRRRDLSPQYSDSQAV